jgi:alpha-glucuronidase
MQSLYTIFARKEMCCIKRSLQLFFVMFLSLTITKGMAGDGYELWLKYKRVTDPGLLQELSLNARSIYVGKNSPTLDIAVAELQKGIAAMTDREIPVTKTITEGAILLVQSDQPGILAKTARLKKDGFYLGSTKLQGKRCVVVTALNDMGILYGTFHLLGLIQQGKSIANLNYVSNPAIQHRILNHWDNLDRTVERGYAGFSLWDWHKLPQYIDQRYHDYARANASLGINGTVLTNVNANALVLTEQYLLKVRALADVFRPYGIRVYLTARFSAPIEIGNLKTADPLDEDVQKWWNEKAAEIYRLIPDFGGFLVKANSEGQPGPQNYGRTHAEGANMLAKSLKPYNGIVMWRAFVYSSEVPTDRVKQAYNEFKPLDGKFDSNVLVQVKNGPLDFQPREPFHPLFGAMKETPLMMEFQLTQEYLGFATHLVYLGTLFSETLQSDTYQKGPGSTVSKVVNGSLYGQTLSAIAGVANIGNDRNWCGHPFGQANWFAFGRLGWNPDALPEDIANEWIARTFSAKPAAVKTITEMMMTSRETVVNYMTPLGLHHIMGYNHHYGPGPWVANKQREDWTSVYYHKADKDGIGFNRSTSGSNALEQYHPKVAAQFNTLDQCPEKYLLWFHHVSWDRQLTSGKTVWEELCARYYQGVEDVNRLRMSWNALKGDIDQDQFQQVSTLLDIQHSEATWWRNACLLYFENISGRKIPSAYVRPERDLAYYQSLEFPFAPGIKPKW